MTEIFIWLSDLGASVQNWDLEVDQYALVLYWNKNCKMEKWIRNKQVWKLNIWGRVVVVVYKNNPIVMCLWQEQVSTEQW